MTTIEGPTAPIVSGSLGSDPVAVVEVGSGSVNLLITDAAALDDGRTDPIRWPIKTRLWSAGARVLDPAGLQATAVAFDRFATVLAEVGGPPVAVVATAVARQAADVGTLEALCRDAFGVELETISGQREAVLGFAGATAGRSQPGPWSLIDIGSGSTELATDAAPGAAPVDGHASISACSLPIGARSVTDDFLHGDPPGADELSSALSVIELHYDDARLELPHLAQALGTGTVFGVGAIGQIAAVEIGLADPHGPVDGHVLTKPDVEEVFRLLATENAVDRAGNPGLLPAHVDDIVGGLCILVEFMRRFGVAQVTVSDRNLRHGRAAELLSTK